MAGSGARWRSAVQRKDEGWHRRARRLPSQDRAAEDQPPTWAATGKQRIRTGAPTQRAARRRVQVTAPMFRSPFRSPIRGRCSLLLMGVGLGEDSCPKVFDRSRLSVGSVGVEPLTGSRTEKESSARRQNDDSRASVRSWVRRPNLQHQEQQRVNGHDPLSHREDFEIAVEAPTTTGLPLLDRARDEH
jgi:hypothetical protein